MLTRLLVDGSTSCIIAKRIIRVKEAAALGLLLVDKVLPASIAGAAGWAIILFVRRPAKTGQ
jgi:hypothetical protein